nr:ATP-binding protein [Mycobacterium avium]
MHTERADTLFKRLRGARLDGTYEDEMRKLHRVELLIIDDLALHRLETTETSDFYELIVERHRKVSTIITSNREPPEILTMMADPLLAQSAMDRLQSAAYELVVEASPTDNAKSQSRSLRLRRIDRQPRRQAPSTGPVSERPTGPMLMANRWSHHPGRRHPLTRAAPNARYSRATGPDGKGMSHSRVSGFREFTGRRTVRRARYGVALTFLVDTSVIKRLDHPRVRWSPSRPRASSRGPV